MNQQLKNMTPEELIKYFHGEIKGSDRRPSWWQ
jgi:hypothetical protein